MNTTDLTQPMRDEKSRAYRVPVEAEWFQERNYVVIEPPKAGDDMAFDGYDLDMLEINLWARLNGQSL